MSLTPIISRGEFVLRDAGSVQHNYLDFAVLDNGFYAAAYIEASGGAGSEFRVALFDPQGNKVSDVAISPPTSNGPSFIPGDAISVVGTEDGKFVVIPEFINPANSFTPFNYTSTEYDSNIVDPLNNGIVIQNLSSSVNREDFDLSFHNGEIFVPSDRDGDNSQVELTPLIGGSSLFFDSNADDIRLTSIDDNFQVAVYEAKDTFNVNGISIETLTVRAVIVPNGGPAVVVDLQSFGDFDVGNPDVAGRYNGNGFAVAFDDGENVFFAAYNLDGSLVTNANGTPGIQTISTTAGIQTDARITTVGENAFDDGYYVIWRDATNNTLSGQRLNNFGERIGDEQVIVDGGSSFGISNYSIETLADGRIVIGWTEFDGSTTTIQQSILDPRANEAGDAAFIQGGDGDDGLTAVQGVDTTILGDSTFGNNPGDDLLFGDTGNDQLFGFGGNDILNGGDGDDLLNGGIGQDQFDGGAGDDTIIGGEGIGDTAVYDGDIRDHRFDAESIASFTISSEENGTDTLSEIERLQFDDGQIFLSGSLFGTAGNDGTLNGNNGNNLIFGFNGNDRLLGGSGNDALVGGRGNDWLIGGDDNDILDGGIGQDRIDGDAGDDIILGGFGNDTINGGAGEDTVDYSGFGGNIEVNLNNNGNPQTAGGGGVDVITNVENIIGGDFADRLTGRADDSRISGGAGGDRIFGLGGDDALFGEGANDFIQGGNGDDFIDGGAGQDQLDGGNGNDIIRGGEGNDLDRLTGAAGEDTLNGGGGRDILRGDSISGGVITTGGADTFEFSEVNDSLAGGQRDIIRDFVQGEDSIFLVDIDAITGGTDDAFTFIGDSGFSNTAGEIRYQFGGNNTIISADVNGDGVADMQIQLNGNIDLIAGDFVL